MADSAHAEKPTCFVAMPVTTPGNYAERLSDTKHFPHVLEHLFSPALTKAGYHVIAPTSRGSQLIHAEIIKNLEQADLVLCDLSSLNANVFFELGIRTSLDRPVVLVKDNVTERIPFDLNAINTHTYDESLTPWTLTNEIEQLAEHVKAVDANAGAGNDMWRYFGLTKRATPAEITGNPTEAKLELILTEMAALRERGAVDFPLARRSSSSPRDHSVNDVGRWFNRAMQDVGVKPNSFDVSPVPDGFLIEFHGSLTDLEKELLEDEGRKWLGVRVRVISDSQ